MISANLTENLFNKLQILPLQKQQQVLDGLEDEELLTNISPAELQALATISLAPDQQTQLSNLIIRNAESSISSEEIIIGVEAVGRATIAALKINRPALVRLRKLWYKLGEHPPK